MSKGIGKLQREILENLDASKKYFEQEYKSYRGYDFIHTHESFTLGGWIISRGFKVKLPDDVYDLRAVLKYLAIKNNKMQPCPSYVSDKFQASFSRALKSLLKRGLLKEYYYIIPILQHDKNTDTNFIEYWSNGVMYLNYRLRQRRFVSLPDVFNTYMG